MPCLQVRIRPRNAEEGGRRNPIGARYRPNWRIPDPAPDQPPRLVSGMIEVMGATTLAPGEKGGVRIFPLAPDQWRHLDVGTAVAMKESPAFVTGEGIVTAVGEMSRHVPGRDVAEARPADR